jgi:hypothetical protein
MSENIFIVTYLKLIRGQKGRRKKEEEGGGEEEGEENGRRRRRKMRKVGGEWRHTLRRKRRKIKRDGRRGMSTGPNEGI